MGYIARTNENKSFCKGYTQKGPGNSCEIQASLMPSYLLNIFTGCLIGILNLDFKHKLLIYLQICPSGNLLPFFQLLEPKTLEFFLTPFILPQLTSILSANSVLPPKYSPNLITLCHIFSCDAGPSHPHLSSGLLQYLYSWSLLLS